MTMELLTALIDVMLFVIAIILFTRIHCSNRRSERSIAALKQAFEADNAKRQHHMNLMKVEIDALNRAKQEFELRLEEFKAYNSELKEKQKEGITHD